MSKSIAISGMDESNHSTFKGNRNRFDWDSVQQDKHRMNYLGNSIKAPVGRWQKGKDLAWYSKSRQERSDLSDFSKSPHSSIEEERLLIKIKEKEVLEQALRETFTPARIKK
jgi:hypothetical protein